MQECCDLDSKDWLEREIARVQADKENIFVQHRLSYGRATSFHDPYVEVWG